MATQAVAPKETRRTWMELLTENEGQFRMALPKVGLTAERVVRIALTAMRGNPDLMLCDPKSVVASITQACEVGLSVSHTLGHAYLVPFNNRKTGKKECTLIIGYKGYMELARRSGKVHPIQTFIVYDKEEFRLVAGSHPYIHHPNPLPPSQRGTTKIGVYAIAPLMDGTSTFAFLWAEEVQALRKRSRASDSGPWVTDEEEMWKKTAIRRLAKALPLSEEWQKAAVIDEMAEIGLQGGDTLTPEVPDIPTDIEDTVQAAKAAFPEAKEPGTGKEEPLL